MHNEWNKHKMLLFGMRGVVTIGDSSVFCSGGIRERKCWLWAVDAVSPVNAESGLVGVAVALRFSCCMNFIHHYPVVTEFHSTLLFCFNFVESFLGCIITCVMKLFVLHCWSNSNIIAHIIACMVISHLYAGGYCWGFSSAISRVSEVNIENENVIRRECCEYCYL